MTIIVSGLDDSVPVTGADVELHHISSSEAP